MLTGQQAQKPLWQYTTFLECIGGLASLFRLQIPVTTNFVFRFFTLYWRGRMTSGYTIRFLSRYTFHTSDKVK